MPDYSQGKIYKIECNVTGLVYIGSTCEPTLARRLAKHRGNYIRWKKDNTKENYVTSFQVLENDNYEIILIETFPCKSKDELHSKEKFYIKNNDCVNKYIPSRTRQEYRQDNIERINAYERSDERKQRNKELYLEHRKEKIKEYYELNKDKINEYKKEYYGLNKDKINEYQKEYKRKEYTCVCGKVVQMRSKLNHFKTLQHNEYIKSNLLSELQA